MLKTTCLINNFNYGDFIVDAVNSALQQSVSFDEIIVVDDCSTDQSVRKLKEHFPDHSKVKLILNETNRGQLSAFNEGYLASQGDLIFFLDSDDIYRSTYLEETLNFYKNHSECDFLFCAYENFGNSVAGLLAHDAVGVFQKYKFNRDLGYSLVATLYSPKWIGTLTSTISMNRRIASRLLPLPLEEDWKGRADDCLLWGASIVGARRFYISQPLVQRRMHGNNYVIQKINKESFYTRNLKLHRLFECLKSKMNYGLDLSSLAMLEFTTIPTPNYEEFKLYLSIIISSNIP